MTALLTLAEATAADWVACARNDVERKQAESSSDGLQVRLARGKGRLYYAAPSREVEKASGSNSRTKLHRCASSMSSTSAPTAATFS